MRRLSLPPFWLRDGPRVGAVRNDRGDLVAEHSSHLRHSRLAALVIRALVQERGYHLILVAAVLQDKRRDTHQMRNVRDRQALARLIAMESVGIGECFYKSVCCQFASSPLIGCGVVRAIRPMALAQQAFNAGFGRGEREAFRAGWTSRVASPGT